MKKAIKAKPPAARPARPRARPRKKEQKTEAVNVVERIREIAIAVGGFDELELPERFKYRPRD